MYDLNGGTGINDFWLFTEADRETLLRLIDGIESIEDFEARMRAQFEGQLKAYTKHIVEVWDYDRSPQMQTHAQWTALVFGGVSRARIAREWDHTNQCIPIKPVLNPKIAYKDAESAVKRGVSRFAKAIGLTLGKPSGAARKKQDKLDRFGLVAEPSVPMLG